MGQTETGYDAKNSIISVILLPKMYNLNLLLIKYQKLTLRNILQNKYPVILRRVKNTKIKVKLRTITDK